jgi:transposase
MIDETSRRIEEYDELIRGMAAEHYPEAQRLAEIPGVGQLTAVTFMLTLNDPARFAKSRDVGSYLGLRPSQRQSGERNPQLGITKAGDSYLRTLLVQCAHTILRRTALDSALKKWGESLCARGGSNAKKRAVVAVARKLAVLLHRLWVSGDCWRPFPAAA